MNKISECETCGAPVYFLPNNNTGNIGPIDAEVSADGNIVIEGTRYRVLTKAERLDETVAFGTRHKSHFVTCKHAKHWGGR